MVVWVVWCGADNSGRELVECENSCVWVFWIALEGGKEDGETGERKRQTLQALSKGGSLTLGTYLP